MLDSYVFVVSSVLSALVLAFFVKTVCYTKKQRKSFSETKTHNQHQACTTPKEDATRWAKKWINTILKN
jgi:hypothetical protein